MVRFCLSSTAERLRVSRQVGNEKASCDYEIGGADSYGSETTPLPRALGTGIVLLCRLKYFFKYIRVVLGKAGENLSVELDIRFLQREDQCAVCHSFGAGCGIQFGSP